MTLDKESEAQRSGKMDLTAAQLIFLRALSQHPAAARRSVDASVVGPLIRANLVRWEDDAGATARRSLTPGSTFTLTPEGTQVLRDRSDASGAETD